MDGQEVMNFLIQLTLSSMYLWSLLCHERRENPSLVGLSNLSNVTKLKLSMRLHEPPSLIVFPIYSLIRGFVVQDL